MLRVSLKSGIVGMRHRAAVGAGRLAGQHPDRVEIVNRVIQQLQPRAHGGRTTRTPRAAAPAAAPRCRRRRRACRAQQVAEREHVGAEPQLEVHRRDQPALRQTLRMARAASSSPPSASESGPASPRGRRGSTPTSSPGTATSNTAFRPADGAGVQRSNTRGTSKSAASPRAASRLDVEQACDGKAKPPVGGQVRGAHDRTGADDDDRPRMRWDVPGLPKGSHQAITGCRTGSPGVRRGAG